MSFIFLNGPINSGKTSLAKALQNQLLHDYLCFSVDAIIKTMPAQSNRLDQTSKCDDFY